MRLVDLFCGTGGFARGAKRAGLDVALAVDIDPNLTFSHHQNFPKTKLLLEDISPLTGSRLEAEAGGRIDGIFGGPPCQGFSSIGRRDPLDVRRKLLGHFFRLVSEARPTFFVMENVRGLLDKGGRGELDDALSLIVNDYNVAEPQVWNASEYGAATNRKRVFVFGTLKGVCEPIVASDIERWKRPAATVHDAIGDLAGAQYVGQDERDVDLWQLNDARTVGPYARDLRTDQGRTSGLRRTAHQPAVTERFAKVEQGRSDPIGRHPRLSWNLQCPTLRAGTGSDKGSYQSVRPLHPSEHRVITVREAARLQGFPDHHQFHPTVWHSFRMIGNSVAPMMAEAVFRGILSKVAPANPMFERGLEPAE